MMNGDDDEFNPLISEASGATVPPPPAHRIAARRLRSVLCVGGFLAALYFAVDQLPLWWGGPTAPSPAPDKTHVSSYAAGDETTDIETWRHNGPQHSPETAPVPPKPAPSATSTVTTAAPEPAQHATAGVDTKDGELEADDNGENATTSDDTGTMTRPALVKTYGSTFPKGFRPHPNIYSESYLPRARPLDRAARQQLTEKWGSWTFVDPSASSSRSGRPDDDYYATYPSRDVPRDVFPPNAWQIDPEYLEEFLPQAKALVRRTMEAILAEYGHGPDDEPSRSFEERSDMFQVTFSNSTSFNLYLNNGDGNTKDAGGYMTPKAYEGLVRRILHAIVTEDTFRVVTGGHSAAAGHGNHFQQSYTLQIQRILEPVFARLGVTMTAHNLAMGGQGTLQSALGFSDIYGDDIDVLVYDSGMTEFETFAMDLFVRQGIFGGSTKVPLLWANQDNRRFFHADIFKYLSEECNADVAVFGTGLRGIPFMASPDEAKDMPWAAQYLKCDPSIKETCREKEYMGKCWYNRDDVTPTREQNDEPDERASFHPGNRFHQLHGRVLTFIILTATDRAIDVWSMAESYALEDSDWHMNKYYNLIRNNLMTLSRNTSCHQQDFYPNRVCDLPLRGRSEYTPRQNPYETSIRSIVKGGNLANQVRPNIYDPPDVHNPSLDPVGVDVLSIAENGGKFGSLLGRRKRIAQRQLYESKNRIANRSVNPQIRTGRGWELDANAAPDNCDGSYDSFCGRAYGSRCLLSGQNNHRGGLKFDGLSGWLILNLEQMLHGLIIVKIDDARSEKVNPTHGWTCENNKCDRSLVGTSDEDESRKGIGFDASLTETSKTSSPFRLLEAKVPEYCKNFTFDFAIDGSVTTWDLEEWQKRERKAQAVVKLWTLLDDPRYTNETKDVELAIRVRGCQSTKSFRLTHIYWA